MDVHDRRNFLTGLGFLLVSPLIAEAQPAGKVPRVGFLLGLSPGPSREVDAFQRGLRELGYIEGQSIAIDYRYARGQVERLPELAAELVRLNPDVIVAPYTPSALAAKRATSTIPIVFAGVADAVGAGLIANLGRPGGNITGLTSTGAELGGKRLELLKQVISKASRVAVLYNPGDGTWGLQRYIPPANEANIQPAYRGASQLRPEYEQSAQPSGEPATESLK